MKAIAKQQMVDQMMRKVSTLLMVSAVAVAMGLSGCKSKEAKPEEATPQAAAEGQKDTSVDSTPMSFDPMGSDSGKINGLETVNFEYDKSALTKSAQKKLANNADWMKKNAKTKVQIEGHCDGRGSIEYNLALGERRANAVKAYIVNLGISPDRLSTISYGKEKPIASGDSDAAYAKNRRANFVPSGM